MRPRRTVALLAALLVGVAGLPPAASASGFNAVSPAAQARYGDRRLDELSFLTTHNAFANYADARWISTNQSQGLRTQLDNGVRGLMLDIHERSGEAYLCHMSSTGCGMWPGITYALPRQPLTPALGQVVAFLASHPDEIVTVFFEDYVAADVLRTALERTPGLADVLFRAERWDVKRNGWPRATDLVASNQRLLLFSGRGGRQSFGVMHDWEYTAQNYWSLGTRGNQLACTSRWGDVPLDRTEPGFRRLFVMSHFRDVPTAITAAIDNGEKLRSRIRQQCAPAAGRTPNFVAVDFHELPLGGTRPASVVADLNAGR